MSRAASAAGEPLEIRLLGELTVLRAGRPVALPASKKTRALLGYLVATGKAHGRDALCELLWEGPDDPRGALRWSLSKLRGVLDDASGARLSADREHAGFLSQGASVDLEQLRVLARARFTEAPLEALEAAAASGGAFLEGLDLPGCVRFYGWCVAQREQTRALQVSLLEALAARLGTAPERALPYARALVALDPLAESSHAQVIRLLAALGRNRQALEEYDRCRSVLAEQIGVRPSAELEQLRASLQPRRLEPASEAPSRAVAAVRAGAEPPPSEALVGRTRELGAITALLEQAGEPGTPNVALLVAESGMGKTRLLEEVGRRAAPRWQVVGGRGFEAEGVRPYGAWVDALRSVPRQLIPEELRPELAVLWPDLGPVRAGSDRTRVFEAMRALLTQLAAARPLLVVLDDLQWLDEGSAALLHFAARAMVGHRVLFGCGARAGALGDNPAALATVRALEREGRVERLTLQPLSESETVELARHVDPAVDGERVRAGAEGNPLFALELARALSRGEADPAASLGLLARGRLEALSEPERSLLPWAAALGRTFGASVLQQVSGLAPPDLLSGLELLERHGVLRAAGADAYDFSHDVLRRAAYAQMSEPRRRLVHRQIAQALEGGGEEVAGELVQHAALAGNHQLAARACVAAGRRCLRMFAWAAADELSRRGVDHASQLGDELRIPLEVELLGLRSAGTRSGALDLDAGLARLAEEAQAHALPTVAAQAFYYRSIALYRDGDLDGAERSSVLRGASGGEASDEEAVAHRLGDARCRAVLERDMGKVKQVLAEVGTGATAQSRLDFEWASGLAHRFDGDYAGAAELLQRAVGRTARGALHWERACVLSALTLTELERARPEEARTWAQQMLEVSSRMGDGVQVPAAQALIALAGVWSGADWEAFDEALEQVRRADGLEMLATLANLGAERAAARGEPERTARLGRVALDAAQRISHVSQVVLAQATLARLGPAGAGPPMDPHPLATGHAPLKGASARARAAAASALLSPPPTQRGS